MSSSKAINSYFKSHMIKQILHEWSFHMKFIKLAEMTTRVRSSNNVNIHWKCVHFKGDKILF